MATFADVFKGLRLSKEYTQEELANRLGFSKSRINMYERGEREPNFETLELISDFFNVDMNYLLGKTNKTTLVLPGVDSAPYQYEKFISLLEQLNDNGRNRMFEYAEYLVSSGKYTRDPVDDAMDELREQVKTDKRAL